MAAQVVQREPAQAPAFAQGFERHVEADLVAEPEAVDDGSRRIEDRHGNAIDIQAVDGIGQGCV